MMRGPTSQSSASFESSESSIVGARALSRDSRGRKQVVQALRSRRAAALVVLHAALVLLYVWTLTASTSVTVWTSGLQCGAKIGDSSVVASSGTFPRGRVSLYASDSRSLRMHSRPIPETVPVSWLWTDLQQLYFGDADSAWDDLTITYANSGEVVLEEDFAPFSRPAIDISTGNWQVSLLGDYAPQATGFATARTPDLGDVTIRADLVRGRTPAGIVVHDDGAGNGMLLEIRPEHGDMLWWKLQNGARVGPLQGAPMHKSWVSMIQDNLRLLLRSYFLSVAIVLILGAAYLIAGIGSRRLGRTRGSTESMAGSVETPAPVQSREESSNHSTVSSARLGITRTDGLVCLLLFLAGLGLAGWVAFFLLERIPHVQDSVAYLFQAKTFALGRLWVPTPPRPEFFEHEFILNYGGKWFSKYPPGHAAVLALGEFFGQAWLVNPIFGALTLVTVYLLGREVYGRNVGALAALLGLASPFWIFMSGSHMAHPTALFFLTLFALCFIRGEREGAWRYYVLAGGCLGMAVLIRPWTAAAVASPFAVWALVSLARNGWTRFWRYIAVGCIVGCFAGLMLAYNAAVTGSPFTNTMELWWAFDRIGFGPGIGGHGPHTVEAGLWNTQRNLTEMMTHLFGWPAYVTLAFALAPFGLMRATRWDWLFLWAWLALVGAYVAWWADGVMYGPRFHYESLSFLLLLTARGVLIVGGEARRLVSTVFGVPVGVGSGGRYSRLALGLVGLLIAVSLAAYVPGQWKLYQGYNYVNAANIRAVESAGIHDALVFVELGQWYEWWNYGSVFSSNSPLLNDDVLYARHLGMDKDRELMSLYPERRYYLLSSHRLTEVE